MVSAKSGGAAGDRDSEFQTLCLRSAQADLQLPGGFVPAVTRYIERQEEHHKSTSFQEELEKLLREIGISIDDVHLL